MKKLFGVFAALALSGCCAFTEVGKFDSDAALRTDDGAKPHAIINVANISYQLFGFIPLESGQTWQKGSFADNRGKWNATFFEDCCSVDENLASVRKALRYLGKNRITNLTNDVETWSAWSLFIVRRKVVKTSCIVLE